MLAIILYQLRKVDRPFHRVHGISFGFFGDANVVPWFGKVPKWRSGWPEFHAVYPAECRRTAQPNGESPRAVAKKPEPDTDTAGSAQKSGLRRTKPARAWKSSG